MRFPGRQDQQAPPAPPKVEPYKTHLAYVKERRSEADGEAILEERSPPLRERGLIQWYGALFTWGSSSSATVLRTT